MTNQGAKTFTPSASKQTGAAGYYSGITVNTDSNLVAANIVSGKKIFGVTGTATVSSLGGKSIYTGTTAYTDYNTEIVVGPTSSPSITLNFGTTLSFTPTRLLITIKTIIPTDPSTASSFPMNNVTIDSKYASSTSNYLCIFSSAGFRYNIQMYITNITKSSCTINFRTTGNNTTKFKITSSPDFTAMS